MRESAKPAAAGRGGGSLWITLALLAALAAITVWCYRPPAPRPLTAHATEFSGLRAALVLRQLLGDESAHPLASTADARVRERIVQRLGALGIPVELQSGWACERVFVCGWVVNIIGRIAGSEPASGAVLLAAHYDSVAAGPGAGDDGVGVAAALESARALRQLPPPRHPIILLLDEGEEAGLLGAHLFVDAHPLARAVYAAVNLDARGDSGPSLMFETGAATDWAMRAYARSIAQPMSNSLYYFIYRLLPNDTDFTVFKAAGYEGLNFALIGDVERYHTPQDRLGNLDRGSLQHQGQNALAAVRALAAADPPRNASAAAGAVFFDLFGRGLVHWPARWTPFVGLLLAAPLAYALLRLRRRAGVTLASLAHSLVALLGGWSATIVVAAALVALLRSAGALPPSSAYAWTAHPLGMHAACVALALLAPAWAARWNAGRTGPWSLWLVNAALIAVLALLTAVTAPELSFLFLLPALATLLAALRALAALRDGAGDAAMPLAVAALPVLGAGLAFLPSLLLVYAALGAAAWPVITAALGLVLFGLAPILNRAPAGTFRSYAVLAAATLVLGGAAMLLQPPYSLQMPQRTLLWYALDADSGEARWLLQPDAKRQAPQLRYDGAATVIAATLPAGNISTLSIARAPRLDYPAPRLQLLGAEARGSGARYHLHLQSVRAAAEIELAVPDGARVKSAWLLSGAQKLPATFWRAADGIGRLKLIGAPPAGIDLDLESADGRELEVKLLDRSYGLPAVAAPLALRAPGPALTTPSQDGDLTIVYRSVRLRPPERAPDP
jgi:hypothetical protein